MASDEEEDLHVLRTAVIASMKAKLKQKEKAIKTGSPAPQDDIEDDPELAALRTVALMSKSKKEEPKPQTTPNFQQQQQQFGGPRYPNQFGPHNNRFGPPNQFGPRHPNQFGPRNPQFQSPNQNPFNPWGNAGGRSNLIVIQTVNLDQPKPPPPPPPQIVPNSALLRPQDKLMAGAAPMAEEKPKATGKFSRYENSDSEEEEEEVVEPKKPESSSSESEISETEETTQENEPSNEATESDDDSESDKENKEKQDKVAEDKDDDPSSKEPTSKKKTIKKKTNNDDTVSQSSQGHSKSSSRSSSSSSSSSDSSSSSSGENDDSSSSDSEEEKDSKNNNKSQQNKVKDSNNKIKTKQNDMKDSHHKKSSLNQVDDEKSGRTLKNRPSKSPVNSRHFNESRSRRNVNEDTKRKPTEEISRKRSSNKGDSGYRDSASKRHKSRSPVSNYQQHRRADKDKKISSYKTESLRENSAATGSSRNDKNISHSRSHSKSSRSSWDENKQKNSGRSSRERNNKDNVRTNQDVRDGDRHKHLTTNQRTDHNRDRNTQNYARKDIDQRNSDRDRKLREKETDKNIASDRPRTSKDIHSSNRHRDNRQKPMGLSPPRRERDQKNKPALKKNSAGGRQRTSIKSNPDDLIHSSDSSFDDEEAASKAMDDDSDSGSDEGGRTKHSKSERNMDDIERERRMRRIAEREEKDQIKSQDKNNRERRSDNQERTNDTRRHFGKGNDRLQSKSHKHDERRQPKEKSIPHIIHTSHKRREQKLVSESDSQSETETNSNFTSSVLSTGKKSSPQKIKKQSPEPVKDKESLSEAKRAEILKALDKIDKKLAAKSKTIPQAIIDSKSPEGKISLIKTKSPECKISLIKTKSPEGKISLTKVETKKLKRKPSSSAHSDSEPDEEVDKAKRKRECASPVVNITFNKEISKEDHVPKVKKSIHERLDTANSDPVHLSKKSIHERLPPDEIEPVRTNKKSVHERLGKVVSSKHEFEKSKTGKKQGSKTSVVRRVVTVDNEVSDDEGSGGDLRKFLSRKKTVNALEPPTISLRTLTGKAKHEDVSKSSLSRKVTRYEDTDMFDSVVTTKTIPSKLSQRKEKFQSNVDNRDDNVDVKLSSSIKSAAKRTSKTTQDSVDATSPTKKIKLKRPVIAKDPEYESQLDARIKKIKEQNAAILARRQQIEAEKRKFSRT